MSDAYVNPELLSR